MIGRIPPIAYVAQCLFGGMGVVFGLGMGSPLGLGVVALAVFLFPLSVRSANQWERAIVLRFGNHTATRGGGLFVVIPFVDEVTSYVDTRVRTTGISADNALTSDTVPVNVDAVIFWRVIDADKAIFGVEDYEGASTSAAQTSLREMIGSTALTTLMSDRKTCDRILLEALRAKTGDWGIEVASVEIRDVKIPTALQDAMSRHAQAERERAARVELAAAEVDIARKTVEAAEIYASNPVALDLRRMNTLFEMQKARGATVIVPSNMASAFDGNAAGLAALAAANADDANAASRAAAAALDAQSKR